MIPLHVPTFCSFGHETHGLMKLLDMKLSPKLLNWSSSCLETKTKGKNALWEASETSGGALESGAFRERRLKTKAS